MPLPMQGGLAGIEPMELDNEADVRGIGNANVPALHNHVSPQQLQVLNPTLDLEQYAASYSGYAKMQRLLYVAEHCPTLQMDALNMLVHYVQTQTLNVTMYQQAYQKLVAAASDAGIPIPPANPSGSDGAGGGPDLTNELPDGEGSRANGVGQMQGFDQQWVEQTSKRAALKLEKLDTDLKHYKSNSIKESIRRGQDDLGEDRKSVV